MTRFQSRSSTAYAEHWPAVITAAYMGVLVLAVSFSTPRRVGDGGEYLVMALRLAALEHPALSGDELDAAKQQLASLGAGFDAALVDYPRLVGADGRQDFLHFWLYPLLVAPFVHLVRALALHPNWAFTFANMAFLAGAVYVVARQLPWPVVVAGFLSPIVWWVDKAHTEVFLYAAISVAAVMFSRVPRLAMLAYAAAGAQNAAIGLTYPLFVVMAWAAARHRWTRRDSAIAVVGGMLVASPFAYTWLRLGTISVMADYAELAVPSISQLAAFVLEPNIGLLASAPVYALALGAAARLSVDRTSPPWWWWPLGICAVLLVAWSWNPNANHGGTPNVNRWVLSLLPLSLSWLGTAYAMMSRLERRILTALIIASSAWSAATHLPARPENYTRPTELAERMWRAGWLRLTPPEVFAERSQHREPPVLPSHHADCGIVLIADLQWPIECVPLGIDIAPACGRSHTMCYAVTRGNATEIIPASHNGFFFQPTVPSWPATGPLARGMRLLLTDMDPLARQWDVDQSRDWIDSAKDIEGTIALRHEGRRFIYIARTGDAPLLRLRIPSSVATVHTLIPVSLLTRVTADEAIAVLEPPPRATNLAVAISPDASLLK